MFPEKCKALLKSADNSLLEKGYASVSLGDATADFTGEFVPLYKIGTVMKIICIEKGHSTHVVTGKVYLSSPKLLRLIDINCQLIDGAENYLTVSDIAIPTKIRSNISRTGIFRPTIKWHECTIMEVSLRGLLVRCSGVADTTDSEFVLLLDKPILSRESEANLKRISGKGPVRYYEFHGKENDFLSEIGVFIRTVSLSVLGIDDD